MIQVKSFFTIKIFAISIIISFFCPFGAYSQTGEHSNSLRDPNTNARTRINEIDNQFSSIEDENENGNKENFKKWKRFWQPRLSEHNTVFNAVDYAYKYNPNSGCPEYIVVNNCETQGNANIPSNWKSIGTLPNSIQKQGKVMAIWNNPSNNNNYMIGTAGSGLWKTTNNGTNWTNLTDVLKLPGMGVSSIAVKPTDHQTIYIATAALFWNYGFGVFKTTNGGATWCYQPLEGNNPWPYAADRNVYRIIMHPTDHDKLVCISDQAMYGTTDGGTNWVRILFIPSAGNASNPEPTIDLRELELDPSQPDRVYLSTTVNFMQGAWGLAGNQDQQCKFFRISNIWNAVANPALLVSTELTTNIAAVSPNVNTVLQQRIAMKLRPSGELIASCGTGGFLIRSTDNGTTWTKVLNATIPGNWAGGIGYWLNALVLDPNNNNHYYLGGTILEEVKMVGANLQFIANPNNYQYWPENNPNTHADIICFNQNNGVLYVGSDGGIFSGNMNTPTWQTRNGDLSTQHCAGLGTNKREGGILSSAQDNGHAIKTIKGIWNHNTYIGDGYESEFEVSRNLSDQGFSVGSGGWVPRFENNSTSPVISTGLYSEIINSLQTTDEGNYGALYTYTPLKLKRADNQDKTNSVVKADYTGNPNNLTITAYKVKDVQAQVIYLGLHQPTTPYSTYSLVKTTTGSFSGTEPTLETFPNPILTIAIDNSITTTASDRVWVGLGDIRDVTDASGNIDPTKTNKHRVYYSCDGGNTFTDVSKGLPVFPIIKLVYDEQSKYLYAATDAGVYVLNTNVAVADQEWVCFSDGLPPTVITDIDLNRCTNKLTVSTQGRGIWETELPWNWEFMNQNDASNTEVLNGGSAVIWSNSRNITKTIVVKNNTQLRIVGTAANPITINMAQRRAIIVEKGSSLVVENATITNECGKFWTGISVMGDPSLGQCNMPSVMSYASAQCANQGVVYLKNAKIENAVIGVRTGDLWYQLNDNWPQFSCCGGGIIVAENSEFRNNRKAVEFMTYGNFWNRSRFLGCDFVSDDYLYGYFNANNDPIGSLEFITAWDVKGVKIDNCHFEVNTNANFTEPVDNYPLAIGAYDARLAITNNTFDKVRYGISMSYSPTSAMYPSVENNTMTDAWRGVYVGCCMNPHQILSNSISLVNNNDYIGPCATLTGLNEAFGIYEDNSFGIQIRENTINYVPDYSTHVNDRNYGIIFHNSNNSGANSVRVRRNTINELNFGITAMGDNNKAQITCNQFNNAIGAPSDIINLYNANSQDATCATIYNGILQNPQGNTNTPAGNLFSDCSVVNLDRFVSDPSTNAIAYHEHTNNPYKVELCATGNVTPILNANACNTFSLCCPPDPIYPTIISSADKDQLLSEIQFVNTQKKGKLRLIDGGNTDYLLDMILDANNSSAYLHQELLATGNYLSDKVLIAIIQGEVNRFSKSELASLIVANSPVTQQVYDELDAVRPEVANNNLVWRAQLYGPSERLILESEINDLQAEEDEKLRRLVEAYLAEDNSDDAITQLLLYGHKEQAIPLLVEQKKYALAQNEINTFEDPDLITVYNIDLNYKMENLTIKSISANDKEALEMIKDKSTRAGLFARNMLGFVDGVYVNKVLPPMPSPISNRKAPRVLNYEKFMPENDYAVFPNPSNGHITVLSYLNHYNSSTTLVVTDIVGKKVYESKLQEGKHKANIELKGLSSGTYILTIFDGNKQVYQTKHTVNAH